MLVSTLSICAMGDISFAGSHERVLYEEIYGSIVTSLKGFDLVVGNLESPLTLARRSVKGKFCLRGDPGWASVMSKSGIRILSLANNHMMDYGDEGLLDTMGCLELAGLYHVGAGRNVEEACRPAQFQSHPLRYLTVFPSVRNNSDRLSY